MDRYSRWVAILKVLLPLAALGLLSTLFLLSRKVDPEATIPFADREIADRLRDQQITAPVFTGTSANGDDIYITASTVSPPIGSKPARATDLEARIQGRGGVRINVHARRGTFEDTIGAATFLDGVVIETSAGYVIETDLLTAQLDQSSATAPGNISGQGPLGMFDAGSMEITPKNDGEGLHIVFNKGIRLVYDPKQPER